MNTCLPIKNLTKISPPQKFIAQSLLTKDFTPSAMVCTLSNTVPMVETVFATAKTFAAIAAPVTRPAIIFSPPCAQGRLFCCKHIIPENLRHQKGLSQQISCPYLSVFFAFIAHIMYLLYELSENLCKNFSDSFQKNTAWDYPCSFNFIAVL